MLFNFGTQQILAYEWQITSHVAWLVTRTILGRVAYTA